MSVSGPSGVGSNGLGALHVNAPAGSRNSGTNLELPLAATPPAPEPPQRIASLVELGGKIAQFAASQLASMLLLVQPPATPVKPNGSVFKKAADAYGNKKDLPGETDRLKNNFDRFETTKKHS